MTNHTQAQSVWGDGAKVELLKRLWADGLSCSSIAAQIGCTRNAVIGKANRLGLERRRSKNLCSGQPRVRKPRNRNRSGSSVLILAPRINPEPFVPLEEIVIPEAQRKTLLELTEETCRWPVGDPQADDFYFCGGEVGPVDCKPYCRAHARIAYTRPASRRAVTAETIRLRQRSHRASQIKAVVAA